MTWLLSAGATILQVAAFLLLWGWMPFTLLFLPDILQFRFRMTEKRARTTSYFVCILGATGLWLAFRYLLPYPFVRSVTQMVS